MADHPHTIDRWDEATGENLIEQIAGVGDYLIALETYRAAVPLPEGRRLTPLAAVHAVVRSVLVDPGANAGRAEFERH